MVECQAQVRENRHLGDGFFLLELVAPEIAAQTRPGQFVMLAVGGENDPLLKRPFGVLDSCGEQISLLYEVVGRGTRLLSEAVANQDLQLVGPLGNGFPHQSGKKILMIAGGRGFAPLFLAAKRLASINRVFFRYGARSRAQLKLAERLDHLSLSGLELFSEDGTVGRKGRVGDGLAQCIEQQGIQVSYSCGPDAMLRALSDGLAGIVGDHYGSFEALMGCGIGICHSCALAMKDGSYRKVCADGPVFRLEDVAWPD